MENFDMINSLLNDIDTNNEVYSKMKEEMKIFLKNKDITSIGESINHMVSIKRDNKMLKKEIKNLRKGL